MAIKSKVKLFRALDYFFSTEEYSKLGLAHPKIGDETYGLKSMIYIWGKDPNVRARLETFLEKEGFRVQKSYHPGSGNLEVQVSYFKGVHWDE